MKCLEKISAKWLTIFVRFDKFDSRIDQRLENVVVKCWPDICQFWQSIYYTYSSSFAQGVLRGFTAWVWIEALEIGCRSLRSCARLRLARRSAASAAELNINDFRGRDRGFFFRLPPLTLSLSHTHFPALFFQNTSNNYYGTISE